MPFRHSIWRIADTPQELLESALQSERTLEDLIAQEPKILSDEWMLIGRQEDTGFGGRIDLLAIAPDGGLVLIELKRNRTPRDVVAQALDYASWVEGLKGEDISRIYGRYKPGRSLTADFSERFGSQLDENSLNQNHQIVVVAASLDESTERIVGYLNDREVPINVLRFQVFTHGTEQLLSRAWLLDPLQTQVSAALSPSRQSEPWNGEFYCSFGVGDGRSWDDAVKFSFISGGGGVWYSRTLLLLNSGDRVWVNVPGHGYVGVGRVVSRAVAASEFAVKVPGSDIQSPILDTATVGTYGSTECFVHVEWLQVVTLNKAVKEIGFFGNQNTVCKPTTPKWRATVDRLKVLFPDFDKR